MTLSPKNRGFQDVPSLQVSYFQYNEKERKGSVIHGMRLRFQKGDYLAAAVTLLLAAAVFLAFLPRETGEIPTAQIYLDGVLIREVHLDDTQEFTVTGDYTNTVTVRDGKIAVTASDCPGGDCVHSGWIGTSGRSVVCLPNRMEIRVVSISGEVDFVVG